MELLIYTTYSLDYDSLRKINQPSILQFVKLHYSYAYNAIIFKFNFNKLFINASNIYLKEKLFEYYLMLFKI